MKISKLLILISSSLVVLTGCNKNKPVEDSSSEEIIDVKDESEYEYTNKIQEPSSTIHNMEDFKLITDYHAFYKDATSFDVTIASDYVYSTRQKTVESEVNYLYWYGELVNGAMGIAGTKKDATTWTINYEFYKNAYMDGHPTSSMLTDLFYKEPTSNRDATYNNFATEDESKPIADVATTQQLWYAAEHGYRINPIAGSKAEKYYNMSKDLLRRIIRDDMSEYQKVSTIYDYIEHHASYCYEALELPNSEDPKNYPDVYCARHKAFFIEGFFDNNTVVCDGYSKIYTLLGRMEGLTIVRGSGTSDQRWASKEVAGHAYCFVELDGEYYLSCPTWGQNRISISQFILEKKYFLAPKSYMDDYPCTDWASFTYATKLNNVDYFKNTSITVGDNTLNAYIEESVTPDNYVQLLKNNNDAFMDLCFVNMSHADTFKSVMVKAGLHYAEINSKEVVFYNI